MLVIDSSLHLSCLRAGEMQATSVSRCFNTVLNRPTENVYQDCRYGVYCSVNVFLIAAVFNNHMYYTVCAKHIYHKGTVPN